MKSEQLKHSVFSSLITSATILHFTASLYQPRHALIKYNDILFHATLNMEYVSKYSIQVREKFMQSSENIQF